MAKYPDEAYAPVMNYYKKLPDNLKPEANKILGNFSKRYKEGEAPPQEMLSSLKVLANKKEAGLEAKINESGTKGAFASFFEGVGKAFSNPIVPATVTALALLYIGMPYIPP